MAKANSTYLVIEELAGIVHQLAQHLRADLLCRKLLAGVAGGNLHCAVAALYYLQDHSAQ